MMRCFIEDVGLKGGSHARQTQTKFLDRCCNRRSVPCRVLADTGGIFSTDKAIPTADKSVEGQGAISVPKGGVLEINFYSSAPRSQLDKRDGREVQCSTTRVEGKTIRSEAISHHTGGSFNQIKEGKINPDLWSPGINPGSHLAKAHFPGRKTETPV